MLRKFGVMICAGMVAGCSAAVGSEWTEEELAVASSQEQPLIDKRFNESGTWLSNTAVVAEERGGEAVTSDSSGRVLVASTYTAADGRGRFTVHRLKHDGTLDTTFGSGGTATVDVGGIQEVRDILVDGTKIVLVGSKTWNNLRLFAAVRLTSTGALDTTFNGTGIQAVGFTNVNAYATKIVKYGADYALGGYVTLADGSQNFALAMLTSAGAFQNAFSADARHTINFAGAKERITGLAVVPNANGNILVAVGQVTVAAPTNSGVGLVGLTAAGAAHAGFNGGAQRVHSVADTPLAPAEVVVDGSNLMVVGHATQSGIRKGFVSRYVNSVAQTMASGSTIQTHLFTRPRAELTSISRVSTAGGVRFFLGGTAYDANSTNFMTVLASVTSTGALDTNFDGDGMIVRALGDAASADASYLSQEVLTDAVLTSNARLYATGVVAHADRGDEAFALVHDIEPNIVRFDAAGAASPPWVNSYLLGRLSDIVYLNAESSRRTELNSLGSVSEVSFFNIAAYDAQAMVARSASSLYVVIRGTESNSGDDITTDLRAINRVDYDGGSLVHRGFLDEMNALKTSVIDSVRANLGARKLWVTGHSLGGAVAHLMAWELRKAGFTPAGVVTFAAPMSGDPVWASMYDAALRNVTHRFVLAGDWIPTLPFIDARYKHVGRQHYIDWTVSPTVVRWDDTVQHSADLSGFPTYHRQWKYYGNLIHLMPAALHY